MQEEVRSKGAPRWLRALRIGFLALVAFGLLFGYQVVRIITDYQWFGEVGYQNVFGGILGAKLTLFFGVSTLFFLLVYTNVWAAFALNASVAKPRLYDEERERFAQIIRSVGRWGSLGIVLLLSLMVGGNASTHWSEYMLFTHPVAFGQVDPQLGNDVGFYVFRLPFLNYLQGTLLFTLAAAAIGAAAIHYGERAVDFASGATATIAPHVRAHVLGLLGVVAVAAAWGHLLGRYDLLLSDNGQFVGAGYTDIHARMPGMVIQACLMLVVAALCWLNTRLWRPFLPPIAGLVLWGVGSALALGVYPGFVQRFRVVPNQYNAEEPYIKRDIEATRQAYGLTAVRTVALDTPAPLLPADLAAERLTTSNIRLWDWPQLGRVYQAKQALKTYYRFGLPPGVPSSTGPYNIDVDRYLINGEERQVMLAPREMFVPGLPQQAQTWVNQRLQYTHGYGVVMSPVNRVDADGLPEYFMEQIPVRSTRPELKLDQPGIYYGELQDEYVFVGTKQNELHYPGPERNEETRYSGKGGVRVGGFMARTAWSMRLGDFNLMLAPDLTSESRVLIRRNIRERAQTVAPFLNWDNDPYLVVADGRLTWIMDAYTVSDRYPYARPYAVGTGYEGVSQEFNYIRNSVKATIDAYDGTLRFYVSDTADPVLRAWSRIFPGLMRPLDQMPQSLRSHIRYPEDLFRVQRDIYTIYHITSPKIYYGKEDQWDVPSDPTDAGDEGSSAGGRMAPYYVNMRQAGEKGAEFLLMTPFTPKAVQNLAAWMCARCDPEHYGELVCYRFPKGSNVNGPQQIMAQVNSQPEISRTVSLLDQRGSRVIWGNLLVIPLGKALVYAMPLYVQASATTSAQIPEISQVILASGDRVVMRPTLDQALLAMVEGRGAAVADGGKEPGAGAKPVTSQLPIPVTDALTRAQAALRRAQESKKGYDAALEELSQALKELQGSRPAPR